MDFNQWDSYIFLIIVYLNFGGGVHASREKSSLLLCKIRFQCKDDVST